MTKQRLFLLIKILIIAVLFVAFGRVFYKAWQQYQAMEVKPTLNWLNLLSAGGVYFLALIPPGIFWYVLLKRFNEGSVEQTPGLWESIRAHVCGQIGKYVPGKVMVVIIRTALIQSSRTSTAVAAAAAFLETLTMMAVGAFVACVFLTYYAIQTGNWTLLAASATMVVCSGAPTIPAVFVWIVRKIGKKKIAAELLNIDHLSFGTLATGWILELFCWAGFAMSYWLTLSAVGVSNLNWIVDFPQVVGVTTFAVSAGFLILFLPGGVGVRDFAFIGLMTPWLESRMPGSGLAMATIASIVVRLLWLSTEAIAAIVLYLSGKWKVEKRKKREARNEKRERVTARID